jgi:hypothetical protein
MREVGDGNRDECGNSQTTHARSAGRFFHRSLIFGLDLADGHLGD